jgi:hypothetical protein
VRRPLGPALSAGPALGLRTARLALLVRALLSVKKRMASGE